MLYMVEKFTYHSGKTGNALNFSSIGNSAEYKEYVSTSTELQKADLTGMKDEEYKAFFLNIYNALAYHATIAISMGLQGLPTADKGAIDYLNWGRLGYLINDYRFTLHDIEHGIIRSNQKAPRRKIKQVLISKHDPRVQFIPKFDPRVHFAMVCGVRAFPGIGVWSSKTLEKDLQAATIGFLTEEVTLDKAKKMVYVPKIFYYYNKDFGKNDTETLKWVVSNMADVPLKEELQQMLKGKLTIKFTKYDWDINNASSEASVDPDSVADQEYQTSTSDPFPSL